MARHDPFEKHERELAQGRHLCETVVSSLTLVNADTDTDLFELVGNPCPSI